MHNTYIVHARVRILVAIVHYFALQWLLFSCVILVHFQCLRVILGRAYDAIVTSFIPQHS